MYVIIFSIDKNYELYQELEEGREMVVLKMKKKFPCTKKSPRNSAGQAPNPLRKGESHHWHLKNLSIKVDIGFRFVKI
jgi:hypothetical protein